MVVSHQEPPTRVKERLRPLLKLDRIDDWTLAEACIDFASYHADHPDLHHLTHQQVNTNLAPVVDIPAYVRASSNLRLKVLTH